MGYMTGVEEELRVKLDPCCNTVVLFLGCIKKSKVLGA